jgi:hypothetical protein
MTYRPVTKTATCKHCGSTNVTWHKSPKSGKFWLSEVFTIDGQEQSEYKDFHSTYCKHPELHAAKQAEFDGVPPEDDQLDEREVEMLALLAGYPPEKRLRQVSEMWTELREAMRRGEDQDKLDKLREIIDLCEDFISELED